MHNVHYDDDEEYWRDIVNVLLSFQSLQRLSIRGYDDEPLPMKSASQLGHCLVDLITCVIPATGYIIR
jgi:hypothetical protein